jgi:hypothetical protein
MPRWIADYQGPEDELKTYGRVSIGYITVEGDTEEEAWAAALEEISHPALCSPGGKITRIELAPSDTEKGFAAQRRGKSLHENPHQYDPLVPVSMARRHEDWDAGYRLAQDYPNAENLEQAIGKHNMEIAHSMLE